MALTAEFLDALRARTALSTLIGASVKLTKKGREFAACCPFHSEKTASFTINDDKGFYHCFGCGAHGDAIRWLIDARGLAFMDAVKELAATAGMEVPAPSPQVKEREEGAESAAQALQRAGDWYAAQLNAATDVQLALEARGITPYEGAKFGLGFAPPRKGVAACGARPEVLAKAGLLVEDRQSGAYRDFFRNRIMIPVHDARGRICGFAGRIHGAGDPKYINSPESDHFSKGDLLFNLHRAAPAARSCRRLIIVEGQLDTIALDQAGIEEVVAPMGTALTERQLERAWRVAHCPVLLFDGDSAGIKAALRAAERAMPYVGPGKSLKIAQLPPGEDPDSLVRRDGREAIEALVDAAVPLADWLWQTMIEAAA